MDGRLLEREDNLVTYCQGHGLGFHEAPFLDAGDPTVLEPGMVVRVEPSLYVKGLGGFLYSDTVTVTKTGCEVLTPYPSKLESLIIEPSS